MTQLDSFSRTRLRQRGGILALVVLCAGVSFGGCNKQNQASPELWEDVAAATGPGQVLVRNDSDQALTRLWFSPNHVEGLWPGATPEGFEALAPGESFQQTIPMGWWDIWFEAEDGADTLLYRTWFGSNQNTEFVIEDSWWLLGDWIEEATPEPPPED